MNCEVPYIQSIENFKSSKTNRSRIRCSNSDCQPLQRDEYEVRKSLCKCFRCTSLSSLISLLSKDQDFKFEENTSTVSS